MLYQSGTQRIEIIVRKEGGSSSQGNNEADVEELGGNQKTWRTSVFGSENPNRIKRVIKTNATHAIAVSKQVLDLGLEYWIGGIGRKEGDQAYQDLVSRKFEQVKDVTNVASSIGMGAVYGAWGGPIGAVLGAVFGAVSSTASLVTKYADREREFNFQQFKLNNSIEYRRARANINLTTGRLR